MKKLLLVYVDWDIEHNPTQMEEIDFDKGIGLMNLLKRWQKAHPDQTLIEAYGVYAKYELYGKHHKIDKITTTTYL